MIKKCFVINPRESQFLVGHNVVLDRVQRIPLYYKVHENKKEKALQRIYKVRERYTYIFTH